MGAPSSSPGAPHAPVVPSRCHHGAHAECLPTRVPPFLDQQETAGLARCSFAHLSFSDSFPLHDASEAHRPFVPREPNQGLGPSTSPRAGLVQPPPLPHQSAAPPSTRQLQGSGLPSSPWQTNQQGGPLHSHKAGFTTQRSKSRKNLLLLQRTDFIFLPMILAHDLLKRLHAPPSPSLGRTLTLHSGKPTGGHFCDQCAGQGSCSSTAAAKIRFS